MDRYDEDFTTVTIPLTTRDGSGSLVAPSGTGGAFEAADFRIYKNGSQAQKATANGLTVVSPFDSVDGVHMLVIDTSVDTGDVGFWTAGAVYDVLLLPDETVDGQTVGEWVGKFMLGPVPANITQALGVDLINEDFTIASATPTAITVPDTDSADVSIPDDGRYAWHALQVVGGTGKGQVVLLGAVTATSRQYSVISGTMPEGLDDTSKIVDRGSWSSNVKAIANTESAATTFKRGLGGVVLGTVGTGSTLASIVTSSLSPAAAVGDQFLGKVVTFDGTTTTAGLRGQSTDITGSAAGGTLTVTALTDAPVSGDTFTIS